jgi:type II secretory pathway pseudopilin PulG
MQIHPAEKPAARAFTLVELLVAAALAVVIASAVTLALVGAGQQAQNAHQDLRNANTARAALDILTHDLRWATQITDLSENNLAFLDAQAAPVSYTLHTADNTLRRHHAGHENLLLRNVYAFDFYVISNSTSHSGDVLIHEIEVHVACAPGPDAWRIANVQLVNAPIDNSGGP